jgi:recombination DNA repair RAD52 pathway protein
MRFRREYQGESIGFGQGTTCFLQLTLEYIPMVQAKKEAVTDATKRALKTFGNVLGNCLYDKEYAKEVVKMKVPPVSRPSFRFESRS